MKGPHLTPNIPVVGLGLIGPHRISIVLTELDSIGLEIDFNIQSILEDNLQVVALCCSEHWACTAEIDNETLDTLKNLIESSMICKGSAAISWDSPRMFKCSSSDGISYGVCKSHSDIQTPSCFQYSYLSVYIKALPAQDFCILLL